MRRSGVPWNGRKVRTAALAFGLALAATLAATQVIPRVAADQEGNHEGDQDEAPNIFQPFRDSTGVLQSGTNDPSLNATSSFFDAGLGTNGQACVTCHQPDQGITITVPFIRDRFEDSNGRDPLFRASDTADRPDADLSSREDREEAFKLFLKLGVVRIGKGLPGTANFVVEPQDTPQFGPLPNANDPQGPKAVAGGALTLSVFRRPLVNTNVNFDSSVLWDGRASITDMLSQVQKASRSLLLSGGPNAPVPTGTNGSINPAVTGAAAQSVVNFMTGVFTDQISDKRAGKLNAKGATGGLQNLLALAANPARPCVFSAPGVLTPFVPATCTPVPPPSAGKTITLFEAWENLPLKGRDANRAAVERGEDLFNNVVLHLDLGGGSIDGLPPNQDRCIGCHATSNIGNNPSPLFFIRLGLDSVDPNTPNSLAQLAAADPRVKRLLDRAKMLPEYCLRPTSDPTPFSTAACGTHPGDVKTTDPGRALVSGAIANVGAFKPPILRNLTIRAPFFHNGAAETLDDLVNFYNARFQIGLTEQQHDDLVAFLRSL